MTKYSKEVSRIIGLDLGDRFSQFCIVNGQGEIVERGRVATTAPGMRNQFEPMAAGIALEAGTHSPWVSNSLDSSDRRLIQTFDTEGGDFIKGGTTMLESIIGCPVCRAECLSTSPALVATTLPRPSRVEAVANDGSDVAFSRGRAVPVGLFMVLGLCRL